ncbi:hypothetical protein EXIGLDRAFT_250738 [Exidia glandulosa HHB12029]|uniref:DUF6533 domain-containing protein n=1 Tax=Exidia glandulosa HHB12029 TaxID=1314781 RepID=A0A165MHH9_EXIGL|nr:hypothetical protein EXIGLDRAFT_250738 [Exidia glandulosa HHB12029]
MPTANHRIFIISAAATDTRPPLSSTSPPPSPTNMDAEYLAALIMVLEQVTLQRYMITAAFAFLMWDLLITFDMEVQQVWMSRDTAFKVFWSFLRYLPVAGTAVGYYGAT